MFGFFKRLGPIEVMDADTVRCGGKVYRLMGFDSPELGRAKSEQEWHMGKRAADRLRELCESPNKVKLKPSGRTDRFNRLLATLHINGKDVAKIAVEEGWGIEFHGEKRKRPDWSQHDQ